MKEQYKEVAKKIKEDLLHQLSDRGVEGQHYKSLVDDYIDLFYISKELIEDINVRGVSIAWANGTKQQGFKRNDSIAELNKTNGQMLKILSELGLRGANVKTTEGDETL